MTQEEKAKAYDGAYKRVAIRFGSNVADELFPELAEPNDEKIRKMLIEFFGKGAENNSSTNGISDKDILSWLEKQGKQKFDWSEEDAFRTSAIANSLEISRNGNPCNGETLEEAAKNHKSAIHIVSPQWTSEVENAFKAGAEWQKKQTIDKAGEWLEEHLLNFWSQKFTNTDYFIEDFKQAMNK